MNYRTHNDPGGPQSASGNCLRGYCPEGTSYERLVELFGPPLEASADGKVDWEWVVAFEDGTIASIYNWKNGPSYGGPGPEAERTWHIGGHYLEPKGLAVEHVHGVLFKDHERPMETARLEARERIRQRQEGRL